MNEFIHCKEKEVLRQLGQRYMEYATLPVQGQKMSMWKAINRGDNQRPMVVIDQLPWHELEAAAPDALICQITDPYWRSVEMDLRRAIYKWENFPVDMVLEPYITIPAAVTNSGYMIGTEEKTIVKTKNETASSHYYISTIKDFEDVEKIKDMQIQYHASEDEENLGEAELIFKGIAPVKKSHGISFHLGVWDKLSTLFGVEQAYIELIECPELIHAAMRRITDATMAGIKAANELGVHNDITPICHCSYVYTDELLPNFGEGRGSVSKNCWAFGMAQLFTSVSPDVTLEFELPYISEMASEFGMIYYGCCDRLDDRLDIIRRIPNLKKVSCSPWSDRTRFAERLGNDLIMSAKPNPACIAQTSFDEDYARQDIKNYITAAKSNDVRVELLFKDISTVSRRPDRLKRWHEIAMEEACR